MNAMELIEALINPNEIFEPRVALVVAHPDDEVIGAGGQLHRWPNVHFIHITNGSPPALDDARAAGCRTRAEYAALRRAEFNRILQKLELPRTRGITLDFGDQQSAMKLPEVIARLRTTLAEVAPSVVLTHPYEGGHPDHDATAFAAHAAQGDWTLLEMTGYHAANGWLQTGQFITPTGEEIGRELSAAEKEQKRFFFDCYKTQRTTLSLFEVERECFRPAPHYDFTKPPHPGRLYYENYPWNMDAALWCGLARDAIDLTTA
jgi:LmbE family N-acetylglucosaminyl deacetylase